MITHLLTRIDLMMNSFSKGQKRIALYIEEHYDKAAFMTASKLGETVGVSESTVVRFATELGYDGYPKLQKAMQEMIRNKLTSVQRIEVTSSRIGNNNVLDSVLNQDIEKIRRTIEETSHEDFDRAVDEICKAKRIYIFGVRSTAAIANFLAYYFELIFDNVRVPESRVIGTKGKGLNVALGCLNISRFIRHLIQFECLLITLNAKTAYIIHRS